MSFYQKSTGHVIPRGIMHSKFAIHLPEKIWFSEVMQHRGQNSDVCSGSRSVINAAE